MQGTGCTQDTAMHPQKDGDFYADLYDVDVDPGKTKAPFGRCVWDYSPTRQACPSASSGIGHVEIWGYVACYNGR